LNEGSESEQPTRPVDLRDDEVDIDLPTREEIERALKYLKNNEAAGADSIEAELLKNEKKGDKLDCKNYRGVCLLNVTYKVFAKILYDRLLPHANAANNRSNLCTAMSLTSHHIIYS
jgi:hypothetical protein